MVRSQINQPAVFRFPDKQDDIHDAFTHSDFAACIDDRHKILSHVCVIWYTGFAREFNHIRYASDKLCDALHHSKFSILLSYLTQLI